MTALPPDLEALMPEHPAFSSILAGTDFYTAAQMREAILAATERAAKLAEDARDAAPVYRDEYDICNELADAIRGTK